MRTFIGGDRATWTAYRTGDLVEDIASFYQRQMDRAGQESVSSKATNLLLWRSGESRYAVHISDGRIENYVVLAAAD